MKTGIHPNYHTDCVVSCSCGNKFTTGSIKEHISVEVCHKCHPLYTGEKRFLDTLGQVGKFQKKQEAAKQFQAANPKSKKEDKKKNQPKSLRELLLEN